MRKKFPRILLIDDEAAWLRGFSIALEATGGFRNITTLSDSREVLPLLKNEPFDLIILDMTMPHFTGLDLLEMLKEDHPEIPTIMLTGRNQIDLAVASIKKGAFDYFLKTDETERIIAGIHRALELSRLREENAFLRQGATSRKLQNPEVFSEIITASESMRAIFFYIEAIKKSSEPVLISGESGVGKEVVARAVQKISYPDNPWVAVNIAGLDDTAFSDTLFGHVKGAYTGADSRRAGMLEQADGGVLFLDEIGDLSLNMQVKLLRLLQEGEYFPLGSDVPKKMNARVVFATNHDLLQKQEEGLFRRDLYYRLSTHRIDIPSLRERKEDVAPLLTRFVEEAAKQLGKSVPKIGASVIPLLCRYDFPGNIRELRAMAFDAVSRHIDGDLEPCHFPGILADAPAFSSEPSAFSGQIIFPETLPTIQESTDQLVSEAMRRADGIQRKAAESLGISGAALSKRLKKDDGKENV